MSSGHELIVLFLNGITFNTGAIIMNKLLDFLIILVIVLAITIWVQKYLDTPTVLVDQYGNCVSVELPEGAGDCNNLPETYNKVITGR